MTRPAVSVQGFYKAVKGRVKISTLNDKDINPSCFKEGILSVFMISLSSVFRLLSMLDRVNTALSVATLRVSLIRHVRDGGAGGPVGGRGEGEADRPAL